MTRDGATRPRRRWPWVLAAVLVAVLSFVVLAGTLAQTDDDPTVDPSPAPTLNLDRGQDQRPPLVFTYFFYWYDAETQQHLEEESGLPVHLPDEPPPSWKSTDWFRKELLDMDEAGIDIALPVYWGDAEPWSVEGLPNLAAAKAEIDESGGSAPDIGLFFDTTILDGRDLTDDSNKAFFYEQIRKFYDRIPREQWGLVDGRPVIWLYFAFFASAFDQGTFDYIYDRFEHDYGVRPYIVRELTWDYTVSNEGGRIVDEDQPIATDANYKWGAALDGYSERGSIAAVGPGFDEREIPGRGDAFRSRDDRAWYFQNFGKAIDSGKRMVVIETWNEIHEASGIGETVEYGREYIELTAELVRELKSRHGAGAQ